MVELVFTKSETAALFATIAWSVWFHRYKIRLNENTRPLGQLVGFARDFICDYKSLKHSFTLVREAVSKRRSPPARKVWKINFDGAMFGESEDVGVEVVVRNSKGKVRAALVEKIKKPPSVESLKLLGTWSG